MSARYLRDIFSSNVLFEDAVRCEDVRDVPKGTTSLELVDDTCNLELLPRLKRLRRLSLVGMENDTIERVAEFKSLQVLSVAYSSCTDLSPLRGLTKLKCLLLQRLGKVTSIDFLADLTSLKALEIADMLRITNLKPLSGLTGLQELKIDSGGMLGKQLTVKTLMPLAELSELRYLWLYVLSADKSLEGLGYLSKLKELNMNGMYPWQEYAKLAGCLPKTECDWLRRKYNEWEHPKCKKCGGRRMIAPPGKGRRVFCGNCFPEKIVELVADYDEQFAIGAEGYW